EYRLPSPFGTVAQVVPGHFEGAARSGRKTRRNARRSRDRGAQRRVRGSSTRRGRVPARAPGCGRSEAPMRDLIHLFEVRLQCHIGCSAEERVEAQELVADISVETDIRPAAQSDDITLTVNYVALADLMQEVAGAREYALVETLVESLAQRVLDRFPVQ